MRDSRKQKRRRYRRRSGACTPLIGPLRLALTGATRSGAAGVGDLLTISVANLCRIRRGSTLIYRKANPLHHPRATIPGR